MSIIKTIKSVVLVIYSLVVIISLIIMIYLIIFSKNTDDNYYEMNKTKLITLQNYIVTNNLKGSFKLNSSPAYNNGSLYEKCVKNTCFIKNIKFVDFISELNIDYIIAYKKYTWKNEYNIDTDLIGISFYLKEGKEIYGDSNNFIYYSKGFFKGKKLGDSFIGDKYSGITKIFNDDWGIISYCYYCGGGAWN